MIDISSNGISINTIEDIHEKIQEDPGVIKEYLQSLPIKTLQFSVKVIIAVLVFIICRRIIRLINKALCKALEKAGAGKTAITFIENLVAFSLNFLLVMAILVNFGVSTSSAVAVIGSIGLTLGFALQGTLSNFAGGVLILILRPFDVGDYIEEKATGMTGTVQSVTIFYTYILTDNNFEVSIPNGALSNNNIINYSRISERRLIMTFNIAYSADFQKARSIIGDVLKKEERIDENGFTPIEIYMKEMGDFSIVVGVRATVKCDKYIDYMRVTWAINEKVKQAFDEEGIEIPFPQLDIHNR